MTDLDLLALRRHARRLLVPWDAPATPGCTLGLVRDGALVLQESAGLASLELGVPIGAETCFRIASVSKQFTCSAILLLAEEGKLSIGDDIRAHLPEMPDFGVRITLDHLMRNCSGLRDMLELMRMGGADLAQPCTAEDLLAAIRRQRSLNFAPGSRFLYSNTNFFLLGRVVEAVSGESLGEFLARRIFTPLGMTRTRHTPSTT
ncbi:MAG: beta-lactamase family protein, partial [Acetobacteraceae bacterium]|nr:beta-lactamase family protein [Acetobacteraceae bacterium]